MALDIRVEDGLPMTVQQARTLLQNETDNFGVFIDLDRTLEYSLHYTLERDYWLDKFLEVVQASGNSFLPSQKQKVRDWFMEYFNIPHRLMRNKANKMSFDKTVKKQLMDANIPEEAKEFLRVYDAWNASAYRVNYLKQYLSLPISDEVSSEGHRMLVANPKWDILSTSRLAANEPSIQNIARDMSDIICCPKGWILVRADSGQIEPRITYSHYIDDKYVRDLIILYDDAYYGMLHYCMLPDDVYNNIGQYSVAVPGEADNNPNVIYKNEITNVEKSKRKDLKVIALAANYGSALAGVDPVLANRYISRIVNNPIRKKWESEVAQQVHYGAEEFYSVFGSVIRPDETDRYQRGTDSWESHVIRCGINNPIQTTASDLMIHSLNRASQILSGTKYSHIAYYKHDEGAFYVHQSEKGVLDELAEVTAYNVTENGKPWIPIHSEVEYGQHVSRSVDTVLDWSDN